MREALRDLTTLGLVEMDPYRGARVREPSREELTEAMERGTGMFRGVQKDASALAAR